MTSSRAFRLLLTRRSRVLATALLPVLALVGCGLAGDSGPPPPCPRVATVADADRLVRFAPTGRDLTDVDFEAEIAQVGGTCAYGDGEVDVDLAVQLIAARGPADEDRRAPFRYFVAVADTGDRILARESFDTIVEFSGNVTRSGVVEELEQHIPLAGERTGADYVIYVGIELTPEELEFNRRQAR